MRSMHMRRGVNMPVVRGGENLSAEAYARDRANVLRTVG
jgi:hypothetical protein